ncbi:MAG: hypothetical protein NTY77_09475 [Elusimicrobia bacterium]|nr:hypothetical protein [Elusimicrobiota bacterium]
MGQVIIPALFLFPTLMLFVYLIYETAKLSREKIRHQFAIDAAVFVEMTNYSDFLNRTAYVNGAFPMRIFDEGFYDTTLDCSMKGGCDSKGAEDKRLWTILCRRGVFPQRNGDCVPRHDDKFSNSDGSWNIRYGGPPGRDKNDDPSNIDGESCPPTGKSPCITILTGLEKDDDANAYWLNWDDANQIYKLYVQIYQLLGSVEDAQYSVLNRLASAHNFLRKSYWLNTGSDVNGAAAASNLFEAGMGSWGLGSSLQYHCYQYVNFYGNKPTGTTFQPWQVYSPDGGPVQMASPINGCHGLFQILTVSDGITGVHHGSSAHDGKLNAALSSSQYGSRGVPVNQFWGGAGDNFIVSKNYFNHDFQTDFPGGGPAIHVSVAIDGYGTGTKASVWPNPTPKFQVRTYP